jgi:hypothetical protein
MDRVGNRGVWRRCDSELSIGEQTDKNVLTWYGNVDRLEENRMVKRVYMLNLEDSRRRGRAKLSWI